MFWHISIKQFVRKSKGDIVQLTLFKNSRRYTIMSTCPSALVSLIDFFTTVYSASVNGPSMIPIPYKIGDIVSSSPSTVRSFPKSSLKWVYHLLILSSLSLTFMMPFLAVLLPVISLNNLQLSSCLNSSSAVNLPDHLVQVFHFSIILLMQFAPMSLHLFFVILSWTPLVSVRGNLQFFSCLAYSWIIWCFCDTIFFSSLVNDKPLQTRANPSKLLRGLPKKTIEKGLYGVFLA